jgi:phospholipid/cholesterol/gamma-HCH transport system substrate-binding protein
LELGLYDFADRNKLVAQYGTDVGLGLFRYGIYASKLGAGLDLGLGARSSLQLDLYDPNRLQFDVRALVDLNKDFALWVGADSLFRKSTPMIGMRLKR